MTSTAEDLARAVAQRLKREADGYGQQFARALLWTVDNGLPRLDADTERKKP